MTSTNFDEPIGVAQAKAHDYVLAVHGYKGSRELTTPLLAEQTMTVLKKL
ncbi:poly-gamma-glutamate hydrolase family protein [Bacillus sp. B6(2022)]|nr:poly-gamma-glutamate hydrolase family protein [Bacillus sp. B6(2022)]